MKLVCKISFALICVTMWGAATAQMPASQEQAIILKRMIERNHFSPRVVSDSFSADVFNKTIEGLDPLHLIFTAEEYAKLAAFRYQLDDELNGGAWKFLPLLSQTYTVAFRRADSLVNLILQKPLDVSVEDKATLSSEKDHQYASNPAELKKTWTKWFKIQLLNYLYDFALAQTPKMSMKEALLKNEAAVRQKLKRAAASQFEELKNPEELNRLVKEVYLSAVATSFDPHTAFFSADDKKGFESALSTEAESFGFIIDEKEGKIIIQHLIPGGPAWRSGELHRNDQLLQFALDGKEFQDATLLDADEVAEFIENPTVKTISLKIKKGDGLMKTVSLRKEKIESEDGRVKGYVLKGAKKVGYISLPDFYTVWDEGTGSSCAEDVAKEIVNLKKEGIEGLILDIRSNGGGSMQEAQEMIGIFINDGPLFGVKGRDGKTSFLKDPNRGTIWDSPMTVMINGQSASASELLAGSLQDYNRAVIVGSNSFGKSTMQRVLPMDTTAGERTVNSPLGFVKITLGKVYRLTGATAQLKGVQPDVQLPDAFDVVEGKEKHMPNALSADTVKRNSYYKALAPLPVKELATASQQRLASNPAFAEIRQYIAQLSAFFKNKNQVVPLKLEAFEKWRPQNNALMSEEESKPSPASSLYTVANHQYEAQRLQGNAYAGEVNAILLRHLQSDSYIEETYRIVLDLIQKTTLK
jgi:carboxyl-terminal processing protease